MTTATASARSAGFVALALGVVLLAGMACLVLFYAIGGPWGTVNDLANGVGAVLSAILAWQLRRAARGWAIALATLGAALAVIGSYLVISSRTGWYLAGLYTSLGYALLGLWLWHVSGRLAGAWPRGLIRFARVTGGCMALGVLAVPGILAGIDAAETAPWWAHAGFVGGLGWFLLYPLVCLWLGRAALASTPAAVAAWPLVEKPR